jgi:hypothetical protein
VGKGVAPVQLPDPGTLAAVMAAKDACQGAEADLANAVALARRAGQPWSAIGTVLDVSRQAAQQRFSRCAGTRSAKPQVVDDHTRFPQTPQISAVALD